MNNECFNTDLITVDEITISKAAIDNNSELSNIDNDHYYFDLSYSFSNSVNVPQKKMKTIFTCEINTFNKSDEKIAISGRFDIVFLFLIENLDHLVLQHEDTLVNSDLIVGLGNIAYATSRGIIYTRCQGTILNKVILPVLSAQKLIEILQPEKG